MIYAQEKNISLILPKNNRCDISCEGVYQLIMQNTYTKQAWMYKVQDFSLGNKLRYDIRFMFLDEMAYGTYQYYLLPDGEWSTDQINVNNARNTIEMVPLNALCHNGSYLIACGKLLVTGQMETSLKSNGSQLVDKNGNFLSFTMQVNDYPAEGEIYKRIKVIASGLIKYDRLKIIDNEPQEFCDNEHFISFKG